MTAHKPLTNSSLILITVLIFISAMGTTNGNRDEQSIAPCSESDTCYKLEVREAISLSIKEVAEAIRYTYSIIKFKSVQTIASPDLMGCLQAIAQRLTLSSKSLKNMHHLQGTPPVNEVDSVKLIVLDSIEVENTCTPAFEGVDPIIPLLLKQKLQNVLLTVENVERRVHGLDDSTGSPGP